MWPPANGSTLHWIRPVKFTVTPEKIQVLKRVYGVPTSMTMSEYRDF
jgi:hypothetical protein